MPHRSMPSNGHTHTLGEFELVLEADGKLASLRLPGGARPLFPPGHSCDLGGGRVYRVGGWDECFPSIEPFGDTTVMGELIGTAAQTRTEPGRITTVWTTDRYRACRVFRLPKADILEVSFEVENRSGKAIEFLWASHAILASDKLCRVKLPDGQMLTDFTCNGTCHKFFVDAAGDVELHSDAFTLRMSTDQPHWGIWFNRGGWPAAKPAGFGCIGIEATNTTSDVPTVAKLKPTDTFRGYVRFCAVASK